MVHPATRRAVGTAIRALGVPLDIGIVFPPKPGAVRGYGQWTNRDLAHHDILAMLPRAAAANVRGGNIYMRLGPRVKDRHPGIAMIDDLTDTAVLQLSRDGFDPCLIVETSPGNFQAWIRLIESGTVPYSTMGLAARYLAKSYGGDERAVSPRQPGRLPGFTNRKPKHQNGGQFPFVRVSHADAGRIAKAGVALVEQYNKTDTAGAPGRAAETPPLAAGSIAIMNPGILARIDAICEQQSIRLQRELEAGSRPAHAASASEVDFATASKALREGIAPSDIVAWLAHRRHDKNPSYAGRTVVAASKLGTNPS